MTKTERKIFKKCSNDILEFTKYIKIYNPEFGYIDAYGNLFKKQVKVLKKLSKNYNKKNSLIISCRQSGMSILMLILSLWITIFKKQKTIGILSVKKSMSSSLLNKFNKMYDNLPDIFKLNIKNSIFFNSIRSKEIEKSDLLILDDFAFFPKLKSSEFLKNNKFNNLIVLSTPNGSDNLFYYLYNEIKRKKDRNWKLFKIHWSDVFNRDVKWKRDMISNLSVGDNDGKYIFNREYNNSFK